MLMHTLLTLIRGCACACVSSHSRPCTCVLARAGLHEWSSTLKHRWFLSPSCWLSLQNVCLPILSLQDLKRVMKELEQNVLDGFLEIPGLASREPSPVPLSTPKTLN